MVKVQQTSVHKICTSRGHTLPLYSGQVTQTSVHKICYSPSQTLLCTVFKVQQPTVPLPATPPFCTIRGTAALCTENLYFPKPHPSSVHLGPERQEGGAREPMHNIRGRTQEFVRKGAGLNGGGVGWKDLILKQVSTLIFIH